MSKKDKLVTLRKKMLADDSLPLKKGATKLVFGAGNPETKILFIGEGPGYHEDQQGLPFVGNAGKVLDKLLESINLDRKEVFISNVVHHRPPQNRDPEETEIAAYQPYMDGIIEIIDPKIIVTLGRFSMGKFIPEARISSVHGKTHRLKWNGKEIIVIPMYHPAAALRRNDVMNQIKEDFLKLPEILKETNKVDVEQMELV